MQPNNIKSSLKKYRGPWNAEAASHLLKRTLFGASKADIQLALKQSLKKTVSRLLETVEEPPEPPLNNYNDEKYTDDEIPAGQTWIHATRLNGMNGGRRRNSFKSWWLGLMINQAPTLREKMVLFWHNHFSTETNTVENPTMCYQHNALLRQYALGNFKTLVRLVSTDPAMLKYLNGNANTKKAPDENFGRELQELFTVGKGPGSHYTELDVKAAARVLTGFRIETKVPGTIRGIFDASRHDEEDKAFSTFYNQQVITGRKGPQGELELDELLDMIFSQEEVSRFLCRKIYRFFVYHDIEPYTEEHIIEPLAKVFRHHEFEIKPVLERLLCSQHFFDTANRGCQIKSPIDFTVGLCRELAIQFPPPSDFMSTYALWNNLQSAAARMQQNIGDPPNVAGWQAYYQSPQFDKIWINSDTLPQRNQFTDRMILNGFSKNGAKIQFDPLAYASRLDNPADPEKLIAESVSLLYQVPLQEEQKTAIRDGILLSGLQGNMAAHYWTDAWNRLQQHPEDLANKKALVAKLRNLYKHLLNLPQYQLG